MVVLNGSRATMQDAPRRAEPALLPTQHRFGAGNERAKCEEAGQPFRVVGAVCDQSGGSLARR